MLNLRHTSSFLTLTLNTVGEKAYKKTIKGKYPNDEPYSCILSVICIIKMSFLLVFYLTIVIVNYGGVSEYKEEIYMLPIACIIEMLWPDEGMLIVRQCYYSS